ncbi:SGNH hydrolase [Sarocladium strictum]
MRSILVFALWASGTIAVPMVERDDDDPLSQAIVALSDIPEYVEPKLNRDITDFLAIGDSFSAGISADVPADEMNWYCSRFKQSYPNQMHNSDRFPGHSTSRTFTFGSCIGAKMKDVVEHQIELGKPGDGGYTPIGKPQVGTLSISGNDLKFGEIVNSCLYHWGISWGPCKDLLKEAHKRLDDPGQTFELEILDVIIKVLIRARTANPEFQLYITGYIRFWNAENPQCDSVTWTEFWHEEAFLTRGLRRDMNDLVLKLNERIKAVVESLSVHYPGVYFVDDFDAKFDGHRFCEEEDDPAYHEEPIAERTWFIHWKTPYEDKKKALAIGSGDTYYDQINSILIPEKDGKSTKDQIEEVDHDLAQLNPAYESYDAMTKELNRLAEEDPVKYSVLPLTWTRVMHPKGSGYKAMADSVIDKILQFSATGADGDNDNGGDDDDSDDDEDGSDEEDREYPCVPDARPEYTSAVCQCSTTVDGEVQALTTSMIDNACDAYTAYPTDATTQAPAATQGPTEKPWTTTIDGTVLAYDAYTVMYGGVYEDVQITYTVGVGDPETISVPAPTQTDVDNEGGGECGTADALSKEGLGEACDRAIGMFEDDHIYKQFTSRYSRSEKGILAAASLGQAACYANFECEKYGNGMSGKLIKEAREYAKSNNDIWMCGHIKLSNSCEIKMNYCTECKSHG